MDLLHRHLFPALWLAWGAYWLISAANTKTSRRVESSASRARHVLPLMVAMLLLWPPTLPGGFLCQRLLPAGPVSFFSGAVVTALGLAFAAWARVHLGRNWSGIVTLKQDHELIRSGPYAWVRHPIYSGLLLALIGSAIARGEWRGVLAVAIAAAAFWVKLRLEERWMVETFGEAYRRYRAEVSALIPLRFR